MNGVCTMLMIHFSLSEESVEVVVVVESVGLVRAASEVVESAEPAVATWGGVESSEPTVAT